MVWFPVGFLEKDVATGFGERKNEFDLPMLRRDLYICFQFPAPVFLGKGPDPRIVHLYGSLGFQTGVKCEALTAWLAADAERKDQKMCGCMIEVAETASDRSLT